MNVKKLLKKTAQHDREQLETESDKLFLANLEAEISKNPIPTQRAYSKKIWMIGVPSLVVVIILIVSIVVFSPNRHTPIEYLEGNFEYIDSSFEELNNDVSQFEIFIDEEIYSFKIRKVVDKISSDTLYYFLKLERADDLIHMEFVVVTNPLFQFNAFPNTTDFYDYTEAAYSVKYQTNKTVDEEFGLEMIHGLAELRKGDEIIYICAYSELIFEGEGSFLETVQGVIK